MTKLTQMIVEGKHCGPVSITAINAVCTYVFSYLRTKTKLKEDEQSEFILFFHPRISSIIENFTNMGVPFEYFLNVHLKFQLLTFHKRSRYRKIKNSLSNNAQFIKDIFQMYQDSNSTCFVSEKFTTAKRFDKITNKRLLFALLKCYGMFSEQEQKDLCRIIELPYSQFTDYIQELEKHTAPRKKRYAYLNERRNLSYYKLLNYEEQLQFVCTDEERDYLSQQIQKAKKTLHRLVNELKSVMIHPTHKEISKLLQIPKGTVDSSLYYLRNAYDKGKLQKAG